MFLSLFLILLGVGALIVALGYALSRPSAPAPEFPPMIAPPVVSAPISCFVKGLIRSMRESSDQWTHERKATGSRSKWHRDSWTHDSGLTINITTTDTDQGKTQRLFVLVHTTSPDEDAALLSAINDYLEAPCVARVLAANAAERAERDAKLAAERAPFEALGCPSDRTPNLNI